MPLLPFTTCLGGIAEARAPIFQALASEAALKSVVTVEIMPKLNRKSSPESAR
jgi:hypothetical protein